MPNLRRTRLNGFLMFLLWVVVSQVVEYGLSMAWVKAAHLDPEHPPDWAPKLFMGIETISFVASLAGALAICWMQRRRLRELGFAPAGALKQFGWGSLIGIVTPTLLVALIAAMGSFTLGTLAMSGTALITNALAWLVAMLGVGLAEEAGFRAAPQFTLGEAITPWGAAIVLSTIFALEHYFFKPGENLADAVSVGLLGLFMAFTVIRSGSIWFAAGFHAFFDYFALIVYGAPNSGNHGQPLATKLLTGGYHGDPRVTGGHLGIEASWFIFPIIAALFLGYHFATRKEKSPSTALDYKSATPA